MRYLIRLFALAIAFAVIAPGIAESKPASTGPKPTIVLVHGAFAESSSWNGVIAALEKDGYTVVAAANPLRGIKSDGAYVASVVKSIKGPVVLVGHSYGGFVITEAANGLPNVKALVYVSAFTPDTGETAFALSAKFPGSTLAESLLAIPMIGGGADLYIDPAKFHAQFAADVPAAQAALMAAAQRPGNQAALTEPAGEVAWKTIPSWFIYGVEDRNIPAALVRFMAERAGARKVVGIKGGSHAVMVSHPAEVAAMIRTAATAN